MKQPTEQCWNAVPAARPQGGDAPHQVALVREATKKQVLEQVIELIEEAKIASQIMGQ